jgi:diguanylate cyclase (GGDEF)-like protein/PAS domain S-box-containing protein
MGTDTRGSADGAIENAPDAILLVDMDGRIAACSRSIEDVLGFHARELVGRGLTSLYHTQNPAADLFAIERLMEDSPPMARKLLRKDGLTVDVLFSAAVCRGAGSVPSNVVISIAKPEVPHSAREITGMGKLLEENPSPVLRISREGILQYANPGSWLLMNHWKADRGQFVPDDIKLKVREILDTQINHEIEIVIGPQVLSFLAVPVAEMGYVNFYGRDVTQQKQALQKIRLDAEVFEHAAEGVMITDSQVRILDVNRAFTTITGYALEEVLGEKPSILQSGRHDEAFYREMWETVNARGSWQGEIWDKRKNGEIYPKWLSLSAVTEGGSPVSHYIGVFSDISAAKQTEESLYYMAHYDALTGLPNRRFFHDRLDQALKEARRSGDIVGLFFLDLDGFKFVNDNLGHRAGDQLLREVAQRLGNCLRATDTVARMGGDEFTIIAPNLRHDHHAASIARSILDGLAPPLKLDGRELFVSASLGITLFPMDAADTETLLKNADIAMYRAKELGKNSYQFYSAELNERTMERLTLYSKLRRALEERELFLHYQPQVDLITGNIVGVEALARWRSPGRFIPLAEESGLIHELGQYILRLSCAEALTWHASGARTIRLGINLSAHQLKRADITDIIEQAVRECGFPPAWLEFEITESSLIEDLKDIAAKLEKLKGLGATIAIDDFGTGYSSLAYLKRLPIDRLKIDRTFVKELPHGKSDGEIATAIIAIARSLGMQVIAEGVENEEQAKFLRERGCDQVQGFYFCEPVSPEKLAPMLLAGRCGSPPARA